MKLPTFSTHGFTVVYEKPTVETDGLVAYNDAMLEIDASKMSQGLLLLLMWHISEGHVRIKVARKNESDIAERWSRASPSCESESTAKQ